MEANETVKGAQTVIAGIDSATEAVKKGAEAKRPAEESLALKGLRDAEEASKKMLEEMRAQADPGYIDRQQRRKENALKVFRVRRLVELTYECTGLLLRTSRSLDDTGKFLDVEGMLANNIAHVFMGAAPAVREEALEKLKVPHAALAAEDINTDGQYILRNVFARLHPQAALSWYGDTMNVDE